MTHKSKIISSRSIGLGGSDARMVLKVGRKGIESLSETDKKRIAVALGQIPYQETFTTKAMEAGNEFEDNLAKTKLKNFESNPKLRGTRKYKNFEVFAHPDFLNDVRVGANSGLHIIEAKYTSSDIDKTAKDYEAQLQWYYMLDPNVRNVELWKGTQGESLEGVRIMTIPKEPVTIEYMLKGVAIIDDFCDDFIYEPKDEWSVTDLLPFEQQDAQLMHNYLSEIKELQEKADYHKQRLLETLIENNVKSLKSDNYTLTVVPEGVTSRFDKAKLFKENPSLSESDYVKQSKRSAYLKISLK